MNSESKVPSPDQIWKNLNKVSDNLDKVSASQAETDRIIKENALSNKEGFEKLRASQAETERIMKQNAKESKADFAELRAIQKQTDLVIQKVGGRFNQRWGALVEALVEGKLVKIFEDQKIDISRTHTRSIGKWIQPDGKVKRREFDIIVANGTEAVVVEVKTTLEAKDVHYFLENVRNFKNYFPRYKDTTIYGAMAFLNVEKESDVLAEEKGLFIIRATGDSALLVNQANFKPKAFA